MDKKTINELYDYKIEFIKNEEELLNLALYFNAPGYVLVPVKNTDIENVLDYSAFKDGSIIKNQTELIKPIKKFAKGGYYKIAIENLPREQREAFYKESMEGVAEIIIKQVKESERIKNNLIFYTLIESWQEINRRGFVDSYQGLAIEKEHHIEQLEKVVVDQLAENDEFINAWFDREGTPKYLGSTEFYYDDRCSAFYKSEKLMKRAIEADDINVVHLVGDTDKKDNLDMVLNCLLANTGDKDKDFETNKRRVENYIAYDSTGFSHLLSNSKYFDKRFFEMLATYVPESFHRVVINNAHRLSAAVDRALFDFARSDFGLKNKDFIEGSSTIICFEYKKIAPYYDEQELYEAYKNNPRLIFSIPAETISKWNKRIEEERAEEAEDNK